MASNLLVDSQSTPDQTFSKGEDNVGLTQSMTINYAHGDTEGDPPDLLQQQHTEYLIEKLYSSMTLEECSQEVLAEGKLLEEKKSQLEDDMTKYSNSLLEIPSLDKGLEVANKLVRSKPSLLNCQNTLKIENSRLLLRFNNSTALAYQSREAALGAKELFEKFQSNATEKLMDVLKQISGANQQIIDAMKKQLRILSPKEKLLRENMMKMIQFLEKEIVKYKLIERFQYSIVEWHAIQLAIDETDCQISVMKRITKKYNITY